MGCPRHRHADRSRAPIQFAHKLRAQLLVSFRAVLCHPERSRGTPDLFECWPTDPIHPDQTTSSTLSARALFLVSFSLCHPEPVRLRSGQAPPRDPNLFERCPTSLSLCHPERSRGTPDLFERWPTHPNHGSIAARDARVSFRSLCHSERSEESRRALPPA